VECVHPFCCSGLATVDPRDTASDALATRMPLEDTTAVANSVDMAHRELGISLFFKALSQPL
jgi:hypothetical protein